MLGDRPTHVHRLANGLTLVVREDAAAPVVAIVTRVEAGYFDEPDAVAGISHVLEHMYFKGTSRRGPGDMARETKAAGGQVNAGTIYDHTSYYTVLPASALELGLDIHSDAFMSSAIDGDELRRELLVILQEAKRKLDNPRAVALESLYATMFDVHRIRRWRIGTEPVLAGLTREDVLRFYRQMYRPSKVVLAVVGDVDARHVIDLVQRFYGDMSSGAPVSDRGPDEPVRRGFRFREMAGDIVRTHVEWGWRAPGPLDPDRALLDLLAAVLGEGRASRLYRDVREAGLVARIGAQNYAAGSIGVLDIAAELEAADTEAALRAIGDVVDRVRSAPVPAAELDRAKNMIEARLLRRLETAQGQANLVADWQALGDWRLVGEYAGRIAAATPKQLRGAAERWLDAELGTLLVYRPAGAPPVLFEADAPAGDAVPSDRGREASAPLPASPRWGEEFDAPRQASDRAAEVDVRIPELTRQETDARAVAVRIEDGIHFYDVSGLPVIVESRPTSRLVSMAVVCRGGVIDEIPANAGITTLMSRASVKGTARRTGARLAEESEALGGVIRASVTADVMQWSLSVPSRHLDAGFALLADVAFAPRFPHDDVDRERKNVLSDLERLRDDMARYPLRLLLSAAFDGHPYGFSVEETEAATRELSAADLEAWHGRRVARGETWVFIVGGIEPDQAAETVARQLHGVSRQRVATGAERRVRPAWPEQPRAHAVTRDKAQTALALGFPGPASADVELYSLRVASSAISGLGGRLFEELRSRRSLAYSVGAYPVPRWLAGAFVAYIATAPAREAEAREQLLDQLIALRDRPLDEPDVERAKRYTIGTWQIRRQGNDEHLADLAAALLLDNGLERIRCFEERIGAVTPVTIQAAAQRYLDPSRVVEGIVRGRQGVGSRE